MAHEQAPEIIPGGSLHKGGTRYTHPAFGTVVISNPHGHIGTLFGSDIGHHSVIKLTINTAILERDLSRDWIFSDKKVVEIELSHAQFAEMITSPGKGGGTPCTIRYRPDPEAKLVELPWIKKIESKHETLRKEVKASAREGLESVKAQVDQLGAMLKDGKLKIGEVRELHRQLALLMDNIPSNLECTVQSAEEALESATSAAKIEVEAYVQATAHRLGLKQIEELGLIEHKSNVRANATAASAAAR